ncbi:phosphate-binding protein [Burkholderia cepacia]|uniref:Phosphate-binding protein n=1 Tax=Burkholderia cepacia TaxID=292 RepID=A0A118KMV8_BURCE|nr:substrate-binding domain-containing protein [Burkholderia cepacia]KVK88953.1 phosphate-binding protein [Burkholderia cepacia]
MCALAASFLTVAACGAPVEPQPASAPRVDDAIPHYAPRPAAIPEGAGYVDRNGAIRIGGAEHAAFIVERFDRLFERTHPGVRLTEQLKGTTSALPLLTSGTILVGPVGRGINAAERTAARRAFGAEPLEIRVAHAANDTSQHLATSLAVYVNRTNPLTRISVDALSKVLSIGNPGGDFSRWGQLGLSGAWAQRAIHPYGTPEYTGFGDYLQEAHLQRRALAPSTEHYGDTGALLARLALDPAGIAVAAIGRDDAGVKALELVDADGVSTRGLPDEIVANRYPLGRFLYFYVARVKGEPLDPVAAEYLRLVLSREGQRIVASQPNGYLPLTADEVRAELAKLDTAAKP